MGGDTGCRTVQIAHAHTRVLDRNGRIAMEDVRVQVLLHSIPCVFRRAGTPDDMEFILGCIRNVICERMVSKELQRLLLEAIGPLCKFSVGTFSIEELRSSLFNLVHEFGHHKHFIPAAATRPKVHKPPTASDNNELVALPELAAWC